MRREYPFSSMKGRRNRFAGRLKKQVTMRIAEDTLEYFRKMAAETGVPYQNLIDSYLADCVRTRRRLKWG